MSAGTSTQPPEAPPDPRPPIDPSLGFDVHPSVAVRAEPFGALVYHYGNRKLVFLKSNRIVSVVRSLGSHKSLDAAMAAAKVPLSARDRYLEAFESLLASNMIIRKDPVVAGSNEGELTHAASR